MFTDTFWRLWGLIDGFNKSHRKISLRVEKTSYELISDTQFWTTPKGDMTHYLFILSKTEPLWKDFKNVLCYRLGTML